MAKNLRQFLGQLADRLPEDLVRIHKALHPAGSNETVCGALTSGR